MTQHQGGARAAVAARRPAVVAFVVGVLITVPATFLALLFTWAEDLTPVLVPGGLLLSPLAPFMATWHGAVNMGLASLANGLVYGVIVFAVVATWSAWRRVGR